MSTTPDLMGLGMSPALAGRLGNTPAALAGVGTAQTGAAAIQTSVTYATTAGGATAFVLPSTASLGRPFYFWNTSATTALVYPPTGGNISSLGANAAFAVPQYMGAIFMCVTGSGTTTQTWEAGPLNGGALGVPAASTFSNSTSFATGPMLPATTTTGTDTTPSVTEMYVAEIFIPANTTVTGLSVLNGSAVAGNIQMALYSSAGALLGSTASTAQSGTAAYQQVALTSALAVLGPAKYYIALQCNNTGARFRSHILGNFGSGKITGGTYGTFPSITVPTTFTTNLGPIASTY